MALPLIELAPLILWAIAFALCVGVVYFSKAFFGVTGTVLGKLPVIGGWIDATAHHIEQRITNVFGDLAARFEARVGASWHSMARLVDRIGHEIATHAGLIATIAQLIPGVGFLGQTYGALNALRLRIGALVHRIEGIGHDTNARVHTVERGIGADVLPRIRSLEREVHGEVVRERTRARTAEHAASREITNLWKWTRAHTVEAGTLAFAGAVAVALGRLRLGWLRCESLGRIGRRIGCGGFGALEELLFGALTAVAATDLCTVADLASGVAYTIRPVLIDLVDVENALVGCHGATAPPALGAAPLSLPSVRSPLPLAA